MLRPVTALSASDTRHIVVVLDTAQVLPQAVQQNIVGRACYGLVERLRICDDLVLKLADLLQEAVHNLLLDFCLLLTQNHCDLLFVAHGLLVQVAVEGLNWA